MAEIHDQKAVEKQQKDGKIAKQNTPVIKIWKESETTDGNNLDNSFPENDSHTLSTELKTEENSREFAKGKQHFLKNGNHLGKTVYESHDLPSKVQEEEGQTYTDIRHEEEATENLSQKHTNGTKIETSDFKIQGHSFTKSKQEGKLSDTYGEELDEKTPQKHRNGNISATLDTKTHTHESIKEEERKQWNTGSQKEINSEQSQKPQNRSNPDTINVINYTTGPRKEKTTLQKHREGDQNEFNEEAFKTNKNMTKSDSLGTKNPCHSLRKLLKKNSFTPKTKAKERKEKCSQTENSHSCLSICRHVEREKDSTCKTKSSDKITRKLRFQCINKTLKDERQDGDEVTHDKPDESDLQVIQLNCEQETSTSITTDDSDVDNSPHFGRMSRYSESDISNNLPSQFLTATNSKRRSRAHSTITWKNLKSPKMDKRPLSVRRNAICEQMERDVLVQGLSLREWRKMILTNYSLIDFDLRF